MTLLHLLHSSGVPKGGIGSSGPPTFLEYGPRDLSKNVVKLMGGGENGISRHLQVFEVHGPKNFSPDPPPPTTLDLDTPLTCSQCRPHIRLKCRDKGGWGHFLLFYLIVLLLISVCRCHSLQSGQEATKSSFCVRKLYLPYITSHLSEIFPQQIIITIILFLCYYYELLS